MDLLPPELTYASMMYLDLASATRCASVARLFCDSYTFKKLPVLDKAYVAHYTTKIFKELQPSPHTWLIILDTLIEFKCPARWCGYYFSPWEWRIQGTNVDATNQIYSLVAGYSNTRGTGNTIAESLYIVMTDKDFIKKAMSIIGGLEIIESFTPEYHSRDSNPWQQQYINLYGHLGARPTIKMTSRKQ